jgi:sugar lactone lactonase YvrE
LSNNTTLGLNGAEGVAVDRSGNVWVANTAGNTVVKATVAGGAVTGSSSFTAGGVAAPAAIAMDSAGNAWVANFNGGSVTALTASGAALSGSPFTGNGLVSVPTGIAITSAGNVLVNSGSGSVINLSNAGAYVSTLTDNALQGSVGLAVDPAGDAIATGFTTGASTAGAVSMFGSSGAAAGVSPVSVGSVTPSGAAADGTSLWVANNVTSGGLVQLTYGSSTVTSPSAGFGTLNAPQGVAVDASGSIWTANSGSNTVSKFIGLASAPVATPLAANVGP